MTRERGELEVRDRASLNLLWSSPIAAAAMAAEGAGVAVVLREGADGVLALLDLETGKMRWRASAR